ncbi:hypothetical protein [Mannheimia haemolytica]|uniref:hypothetical protein n=2 Tax=Mannheimia haemolytica TaxID=75985 RepID=UPI00115DB683|nr:hypothetical protein [Mannheimia haemolytica]MDW1150547.1 hypothetical protein [Mannheimia haemolytica]MDW1160705.1 hypothetical protein [Mannheimia haemolytica]NBB68047.1 hypothetical protein [Mannheimia haemolytica]TRC51475.1 hypothetical protein FEA40_00375 [Mannheimia haemolytica]TRC51574.1 hypothetical protein FEA32_00345 [Mannheimia haemolytica]
MKFVVNKLFSPLNYLRIFHREKIFFDVVLPLLFTTIFLIINYKFLPHKLPILGNDGIVNIVNGILQILSGFYIASLAAIATASLPSLDEIMRGVPPKYIGKKSKNITRRVFLTHLFGYLSFVSLLLYFTGAIAKISISNFHIILENIYLKLVFSFIYLFGIFNLVFVTILGLFFMIEDNINKK